MADGPHSSSEPTLWRVGPPVAAAVLAAVITVVMLAAPVGPAQAGALIVVLLLQAALLGVRAFSLRPRTSVDWAVRWHRFLFAWSSFASVIYLLGGDRSRVAAATYVGAGLLFGAVVTLRFWGE